MQPVDFELKDRNGKNHQYVTQPHPPSEAHRLVLALDAAIAPPLADVLVGLFQGDMSEFAEMQVSTVLAQIDLPSIAMNLSQTLLTLDPVLVQSIFKFTMRDGEELRNVDFYDRAYAGNWTEWHLALVKIVRANGFVPFLHMLGASG